MRWIASVLFALVAVSLAGASGCDNGPLKYTGQCSVQKLNGKVSVVEIQIKNENNGQTVTFTGRRRSDMNAFIDGLESLLADAKVARDEMDILEPPLHRTP